MTLFKNTRLKDLCVARISNGAFNDPQKVGSGYRLINVKDLYTEPTIDEEKLCLLELTEKEFERHSVKTGDLFFTRSSLKAEGIAHCNIYTGVSEDIVYECHIMRARVDQQTVIPLFLFHYCKSYQSRKYFIRHSKVATMTTIDQSDLGRLPIALPPLPEQKAIAALLSTWDEAIEKTERLIQAKEKQLRQMSRWLLFGHKRLGNQKTELADGHFFKYPSDWALVKIGKVAKEVSARNGESDETVLSCSKYDGFVNSLDYFGKQVFSSDTSNYKVVKKGQFGYPSNHVEEGSIGLLEHCEKGIVSPIYIVFEASKEKVHSPYLYKLLKTDIYRHIFQVSTSSSVDRRGSLRWGDFSKIKVLVPSLKEQQEISETLSSAQHEIDLLKQLVEKYKAQKRGLMQKMLTGEWRVKPKVVKDYAEQIK
jgi:type I restriction enzyme S subunit